MLFKYTLIYSFIHYGPDIDGLPFQTVDKQQPGQSRKRLNAKHKFASFGDLKNIF